MLTSFRRPEWPWWTALTVLLIGFLVVYLTASGPTRLPRMTPEILR